MCKGAVDRFFKLKSFFGRFFKRACVLDRLLIGGISVVNLSEVRLHALCLSLLDLMTISGA